MSAGATGADGEHAAAAAAASRRPFLQARWTNLLLVSYAVPDRWLLPHLPRGLQLDRWQGSACVSLVAFDFGDTRVAGVGWPGFVRFPEVNLRCYVRGGDQRGVVFLRELVPSRWVAHLARTLYGEPYRALPMTSAHATTGWHQHTLWVAGRPQRITWHSPGPPRLPPPDAPEEFFKEHAWGFGALAGGRVVRYRVVHPRWRVYTVRDYRVEVDFAALYGPPWGRLHERAPISVVHAEGSAIEVYRSSVLIG